MPRRFSCSVIPECEFLEKVFGFDQTLVQVQTANDGDGVPLFLVHDGSGMTSGYTRIGALGRAVWSINNPKLLSGEHWVGGIPEMAGHYINEISAALTHDGWILGGWSFGGIVAFHMACEMQRAGIKVAGVILIDSPSPFSTEPLPPVLIDAVLPTAEFSNVRHARIASLVRTQMNHSTHAVVAYEPQSAPRPYPRLVMVRCTEAFDVSAVPGCGALTFLTDRRDPRSAVEDWERLVGGTVEVLDIPGHHFEPFHPKHVMGLTEQLQNAISLLTS